MLKAAPKTNLSQLAKPQSTVDGSVERVAERKMFQRWGSCYPGDGLVEAPPKHERLEDRWPHNPGD